MAGRFAAASILCYLIFLAPLLCRIAGLESRDAGYLLLIAALPALSSAITSSLIVGRGLCFAPPIIGWVAAFASNQVSDRLLAMASEAYFTWQFLLALVLAPLLSMGFSRLAKPREISEAAIYVGESEAVEEPSAIEAEVELITCPYCGGGIPAGSIYCPLCGGRIREE